MEKIHKIKKWGKRNLSLLSPPQNQKKSTTKSKRKKCPKKENHVKIFSNKKKSKNNKIRKIFCFFLFLFSLFF